MRSGERKRFVYLAYLKPNAVKGDFMIIAADDYKQAFGFAVQNNAQGLMMQIQGAIAYTKQAPIELEEVTP